VLALVSANADATNTLASAIRGAGLAVADIRAHAEERIAVSLPVATLSLAMEANPAADTMAMKAAPEAATMMAAPADEPTPEARSAKVSNTDNATTGESEEQYDSRAANRMKVSAEAQLKAAQKKLKSFKASAEIKAEAEEQLSLSENHIEEGHTFLNDKAYAQAYHAFQQSLLISEKLNVLLKSETAFKKASTRATEARINARLKAKEVNEEPRSSTTNAKIQANVEASGTPIDLEVETEAGATIHEVIPVIPQTLRIFKMDDEEDDRGGLINIGL
jgi:methionine-rich copper-binding protein CopC